MSENNNKKQAYQLTRSEVVSGVVIPPEDMRQLGIPTPPRVGINDTMITGGPNPLGIWHRLLYLG